jgi:putative tricarboxylic transport membrane protein
MSREDWRRSWPAWLRATAIGFPFGTIPAGGAEIRAYLSYALEKKLTKHPEEFGNGAIEDVAGPEAANNASSAGVLVPLLTLGIQTSATVAILIAAFQSYGLQFGPQLFQTQAALARGLIASMYVGNCLLLILDLPLIGLWVKVLMIPRALLYAGILVFATLGAFSLHQSVADLMTLYVFGLLGFMMRRWGFPVAPAVIGLILGSLAESQFRRALAISARAIRRCSSRIRFRNASRTDCASRHRAMACQGIPGAPGARSGAAVGGWSEETMEAAARRVVAIAVSGGVV